MDELLKWFQDQFGLTALGAGIAIVILGVFWFLVQTSIREKSTNAINEHKSTLDRKLEALRGGLAVEEKRLTEYERRQGDALALFYGHLWGLQRRTSEIAEKCADGLSFGSLRSKNLKELTASIVEFEKGLGLWAVYIPEELESMMRGVTTRMLSRASKLLEEEQRRVPFEERDKMTRVDAAEIEKVTQEVKRTVRALLSRRIAEPVLPAPPAREAPVE